MLTLTIRRTASGDPVEARSRLGRGVREILRRAARETGVQAAYFVAIEKHKSGWPHAHIALRGWKFVGHKRLSRQWLAITGDSSHVHIRRLPQRRLAKYLAKYLGKDLHRFGTFKRYWCSQDWLPDDMPTMSAEQAEQYQGWEPDKRHPSDVVAGLQKAGWYTFRTGWGCYTMTPALWLSGGATGPPTVVGGRP
jgi:hypothetical protein